MTPGHPRDPHRAHRTLFLLALRLYPHSFRERFGARMQQDFGRILRDCPSTSARHRATLRECFDLVVARLRRRRDDLLPVSAFPETDLMSFRERLADLSSDLRLALRGLRQRPGYSAIIVVTLALGVGASAAIYTVIDAVLWAPLPYAQPDELIALFRADPERGTANRFPLTTTAYREWTVRATTLADTAAFASSNMVVFEADDWPQRISTASIEPGMLELLGARPALGGPLPDDDEATALLAHAFWQRAFGGDPDIVGRTIRLDGRDHLVVGVMPPEFRFPHYSQVAVWRNLKIEPTVPGPDEPAWLMVVGRMAPGASRTAVHEELDRIAPRVAAEHGVEDWTHANVIGLRDMDTGFIRPVLLLLALAVVLLLVIAAVNLAGLTLARGIGRRREMAVRAALGAGRLQLSRLLFLELLLLALLGGGFGALTGAAAVGGLMQVAPTWPPSLATAAFGAEGFLVAVLLALVVCGAFGLVPALRLSRPRIEVALREGGRGASAGALNSLSRRLLVGAQMGLAAVLLVGAALMVRSMLNILATDLGMEPEGLVTARVGRSGAADGAPDTSGFADTLLERAQSLAWIQDVAATSSAPMGPGADWKRLRIDGEDPSQRMALGSEYRQVSPGYMELLGLRRLQGRLLTPADNVNGAPPVTVVSKNFVDRFLDGEEAVGKIVETRTSMGLEESTRSWEIVGVVDDVREYGATGFIVPLMYVPLAQDPPRAFSLLLRTDIPIGKIQDLLRELASTIDASRPVERVAPLTDDLQRGNRLHAFVLVLLGGFAVIAMTLAAVGLYGTMSQQVGARTREIAVRCALGADASLIRRMVLRSGGLLAVVGLGLGLVASLPVTRQMAGMMQSTLLVDVTWWDPLTFTVVPAVLALVALVASAVPARRAASVDPATALRAEG